MTPNALDACALTSGVTCVLGVSLSQVNAFLTAVSLLVSIVAGLVALWPKIKKQIEKL